MAMEISAEDPEDADEEELRWQPVRWRGYPFGEAEFLARLSPTPLLIRVLRVIRILRGNSQRGFQITSLRKSD